MWEDASRAPSGTGLHRKSTPAARRHHLIGRIVVCGHLATADLAWLALQAHPTAIDLRTPAEDGVGGLSFAEAHRLAVDLGIAYHHVPIARGIRSRDGIGEARAILRAAPGCVLLHCPDGLRAGALALIHLGCDAGRSLGECYTQAAKLPVQPPVEVWVGYILDEPYQGRPPVPERR